MSSDSKIDDLLKQPPASAEEEFIDIDERHDVVPPLPDIIPVEKFKPISEQDFNATKAWVESIKNDPTVKFEPVKQDVTVVDERDAQELIQTAKTEAQLAQEEAERAIDELLKQAAAFASSQNENTQSAETEEDTPLPDQASIEELLRQATFEDPNVTTEGGPIAEQSVAASETLEPTVENVTAEATPEPVEAAPASTIINDLPDIKVAQNEVNQEAFLNRQRQKQAERAEKERMKEAPFTAPEGPQSSIAETIEDKANEGKEELIAQINYGEKNRSDYDIVRSVLPRFMHSFVDKIEAKRVTKKVDSTSVYLTKLESDRTRRQVELKQQQDQIAEIDGQLARLQNDRNLTESKRNSLNRILEKKKTKINDKAQEIQNEIGSIEVRWQESQGKLKNYEKQRDGAVDLVKARLAEKITPLTETRDILQSKRDELKREAIEIKKRIPELTERLRQIKRKAHSKKLERDIENQLARIKKAVDKHQKEAFALDRKIIAQDEKLSKFGVQRDSMENLKENRSNEHEGRGEGFAGITIDQSAESRPQEFNPENFSAPEEINEQPEVPVASPEGTQPEAAPSPEREAAQDEVAEEPVIEQPEVEAPQKPEERVEQEQFPAEPRIEKMVTSVDEYIDKWNVFADDHRGNDLPEINIKGLLKTFLRGKIFGAMSRQFKDFDKNKMNARQFGAFFDTYVKLKHPKRQDELKAAYNYFTKTYLPQ